MKVFLTIILSINIFITNASHIVGGEIYYDYLGSNNYQFYISVYRDCLSTGASFDSPLYLAVYNENNLLIQNITVPYPGSSNVPIIFNNPCVTPPSNVCTENALYTTIINLPPSQGGYNITYQRCCRGPNISNLVNPDDAGFTLTCHVPGGNNFINSSPRFTNYPPLVLCNNADLIFDHSATDPDGDLLTYSLITPFTGASGLNPLPNPAPPPPYSNVTWNGGFNFTNPLGPGASINIDPNSGSLNASPNLTGLFVVGIQVQEWRNGVVINQTVRDFLFNVFSCQVDLQAILPNQVDLPNFTSYCDGLTVDFVNNSFGGTNYAWDFGVSGTNTDISSSFEPTFTYPSPGQYEVMLVVNPGWPCTDTTYMDIIINNQLDILFTSNDSMCIFNNNFDFIGPTNTLPGTTYNWDFGPNANQANATTQNVNNISFSSTGFIPITLNAEYGTCSASYTDSVYIFPEPISEIIIPQNIECEGLSINFSNNSQESTIYSWDFGVSGTNADTSNLENPTFTFPASGTYNISLISGSSISCSDTAVETIILNEELMVSFSSEDSLCFTNNSFNFDGTVSGPSHAIYTWDFGNNSNVNSSTDIDVSNVSFSITGSIPITLTGTHDDCIESVTNYIYIYQEPSINFSSMSNFGCSPFEVRFIDQSFAETDILYSWDFGDGNISSEQNPINTYINVGDYSVSLIIETLSGCIDTLDMTQENMISVKPNPVAGFSSNMDITDICNSLIIFNDESIGANSHYYIFDDLNNTSNEQSPHYVYQSGGTHYPIQIVTNEFGCKDSIRSKIIIEPYTIYAPNSFTPDGDEFNNTFLPVAYLGSYSWHLTILNRWGGIIFESYDSNIGWDGTAPNGILAEEGMYIWKLEYTSCEPENPTNIITGHITLLK